MRCLVGIDDTDSRRGYCTTYLAYRIAADLSPTVRVLPYPRLVRLNPNIPFKTRGNAAICLEVETPDTHLAFALICGKVKELSDVRGGANSGVALLEDPKGAHAFEPLYLRALRGVVSPHFARRLLKENHALTMELGNGMGVVGAASSLGFDEKLDHTFELISYRNKESWGTPRSIDPSSVRWMDEATFPHTFNNYDYHKRRVLISPHGPDPVFLGVRGDSANAVLSAFKMLRFGESTCGHMIFVTNQHTDAHLGSEVDWKAYSSGWVEGYVSRVDIGEGGHVYIALETRSASLLAAAYEPTGDLRRTARLLKKGDKVKAYGGVRRATRLHPKVLNVEKLTVDSAPGRGRLLRRGTYVSSPRANRHLTKPLIRYGMESSVTEPAVDGWLSYEPRQQRVLVRNR